jgi:asparagine synthase (glutamine-hydrolysing)
MSKFVSQHVKVVLGGLGGDELFSGYDIHRYIYPFNKFHHMVPEWLERKVSSRMSQLVYSLQTKLSGHSLDEYRRGVQVLLATGNVSKFYLILRNAWDYDHLAWKRIYQPEFYQQKLQPVISEFQNLFKGQDQKTALQQVYGVEFQTKMVNDYLLTEDRMSMANSVEERVPFLDLDMEI